MAIVTLAPLDRRATPHGQASARGDPHINPVVGLDE
jgi:hypothetical protein